VERVQRREFLRNLGLTSVAVIGRDLWESAFALAAVPVAGDGPYGPLGGPDANGIQLPAGFASRVVARTGAPVAGTAHVWHQAPDGGACFAVADGGWVYVSNSEVAVGGGGVGALRFDSAGAIVAAFSILTGTTRNCAGGATPWGTWLSCEENGDVGRVWECDPQQPGQGTVRPLLGRFSHEAAAVDPATGIVYLSEDNPLGRLYRFVPVVLGDLTAGVLQAATLVGDVVTWSDTSTTGPDRRTETTAFDGGEGMWFGNGVVYLTTKGDGKLWELTPSTDRLRVLYDIGTSAPSALNAVDNVTVHGPSGDVFVAEDGGNMELCMLATVGLTSQIAPFLRIAGQTLSEITGPAFNPDGSRLYVSSQRGPDGRGVTYEISGPFRATPSPPAPVGLASVSPRRLGQNASWRSVKVLGSGFVSGSTIGFTGTGITVKSRTYNSPTQLTLMLSVAGTAEPGDRDVTVTNPDGGTATIAHGYTVAAAPLIGAVTPATISRSRTTAIDIDGANFASGAKVVVAGPGIDSVVATFVSPTRLRVNVAVAGSAPIGQRAITVTNLDAGVTIKNAALTIADAAPPAPVAITALSPRRLGQNASWRTLTLNGSGFTPTTVVAVSGTDVTVKSRTYVSPTQLTLMVSVGAAALVGDRNVTAANPDGGVAALASGFTVTPAPAIASLSPSGLPRGATTTIDINGANFAAGVSVTISGTGISSIGTTRVDATRLRAVIGLAASAPTGARSLTVRNADAGVTTKVSAVTVT
jgi:uncharacterized protein